MPPIREINAFDVNSSSHPHTIHWAIMLLCQRYQDKVVGYGLFTGEFPRYQSKTTCSYLLF
jgi:hypothetical protein